MLTYRPPSPPEPVQRDHFQLFILLGLAWLIPGTFWHAPWLSEEAQIISLVDGLVRQPTWSLPHLAGQPFFLRPPLVAWFGGLVASVLSPRFLSELEAARLASSAVVGSVFIILGLAGRTLWDNRLGRSVVLLLMGTAGLALSAHQLMPEHGALLGYALFLYAALCFQNHARYATIGVAAGIAVAFFGGGFISAAVLYATLVFFLPGLLTSDRRARLYGFYLPCIILLSLSLIALWPLSIQLSQPQQLKAWATYYLPPLRWSPDSLQFYSRQIIWSAWPAWPLALKTLIARRCPATVKRYRWLLFTVALFWLLSLGFQTEQRAPRATIVLLPLSLLAAPALDLIGRGAIAAFRWFSLACFSTFTLLLWFGWQASLTGWPQRLAGYLERRSPSYQPTFAWGPVLLALVLTAGWIGFVSRSRLSGRMALSNWTAGVTLLLGVGAALWLPWIESAQDYRPLLQQIRRHVPASQCVLNHRVPLTAVALLDYYERLQLKVSPAQCPTLLSYERKETPQTPPPNWQLYWEGVRTADQKYRYRLYRDQP